MSTWLRQNIYSAYEMIVGILSAKVMMLDLYRPGGRGRALLDSFWGTGKYSGRNWHAESV